MEWKTLRKIILAVLAIVSTILYFLDLTFNYMLYVFFFLLLTEAIVINVKKYKVSGLVLLFKKWRVLILSVVLISSLLLNTIIYLNYLGLQKNIENSANMSEMRVRIYLSLKGYEQETIMKKSIFALSDKVNTISKYLYFIDKSDDRMYYQTLYSYKDYLNDIANKMVNGKKLTNRDYEIYSRINYNLAVWSSQMEKYKRMDGVFVSDVNVIRALTEVMPQWKDVEAPASLEK